MQQGPYSARVAQWADASQIDLAIGVRQPLQRTIKPRPAWSLRIPRQGGGAFTRARRSQFQLSQGLGARPDTLADIVPTDD
ncbi:hypothetical protein D3C86_1266110 [compost metagenome]